MRRHLLGLLAGAAIAARADAACLPRLGGPIALTQLTGSVLAADFDRDGIEDLAAIDDTRRLVLLLGDRSGEARRRPTPIPVVLLRQVVDFDGDGAPDLFAATFDGPAILLGDGSGGFRVLPLKGFPVSSGAMLMAEATGDSRLDLLVASPDASLIVLEGDGAGSFHGPPEVFDNPYCTVRMLVADLNHDGRPDVVVTNTGGHPYRCATALMSVLLGRGDGTFVPAPLPVPQPVPGGDLGSGDLDGDGHPDLVVGRSVLWGDGTGGFPSSTTYAPPVSGSVFAVADVDGDGLADILQARAGELVLSPGSRTRVFGDPSVVAAGGGLNAFPPVLTPDLNGDGRIDVVGRAEAGHALAFLQLCGGARFARTFLVPIALSAAGAYGSAFETELVLTNHGTADAAVELTYTAAFGGGTGSVRLGLGAGRQLLVRDVIGELRRRGLTLPESGDRGGSLRVRFTGLDDPSAATASARILAVTGEGRSGVGFPPIPIESAFSGQAFLPWLQETASERTNLALVNAGTPGDGEVTLRVSLMVGGAYASSFDVTLPPGGFAQRNRVLAPFGQTGWARVDRISGTAPWYAYAAVNDNVTSDASLIPALPATAEYDAEMPVVEGGGYLTELVLTNLSDATSTVTLELGSTASPPGYYPRYEQELRPREQLLVPNVYEAFRRNAFVVPPPAGPLYAGSLRVTPRFAGIEPGVRAVGRTVGTRTPHYGVAYAARRATYASALWVDGLRQDAYDRTNLALAGSYLYVSPEITLYDGDSGREVASFTIDARTFLQLDRVLQTYAPGVSNGYARVRLPDGPFGGYAYGVINDGPLPGAGTGDGTFLPGWPSSAP